MEAQEITWTTEEEANTTGLLKYVPASGEDPFQPPGADPASASGGTWMIRGGNYITLAELFRFGCGICSCFDLYRMYVALPIFIHKRYHSQSNSAPAQKRRNAKILRNQEFGVWGLPRR